MIAVALAWVWRNLPFILLFAGGWALAEWALHNREVTTEKRVSAAYELKIAKLQQDATAQHLSDLTAARKSEQAHVTQLSTIDQTFQAKAANEKAIADKTVADLRSGALRLRSRFTAFSCPSSASGVSSAAAGPSFSALAGSAGLQIQDAEFLVSESARADQVAVQLQACQSVVRADREN